MQQIDEITAGHLKAVFCGRERLILHCPNIGADRALHQFHSIVECGLWSGISAEWHVSDLMFPTGTGGVAPDSLRKFG